METARQTSRDAGFPEQAAARIANATIAVVNVSSVTATGCICVAGSNPVTSGAVPAILPGQRMRIHLEKKGLWGSSFRPPVTRDVTPTIVNGVSGYRLDREYVPDSGRPSRIITTDRQVLEHGFRHVNTFYTDEREGRNMVVVVNRTYQRCNARIAIQRLPLVFSDQHPTNIDDAYMYGDYAISSDPLRFFQKFGFVFRCAGDSFYSESLDEHVPKLQLNGLPLDHVRLQDVTAMLQRVARSRQEAMRMHYRR